MDQQKAEQFEEKLLELRSRITGDYERRVDASAEEFGGDVPDVNDEASRTISRRILLAIGDRNYDLLVKIEEAIERIQNGEYGQCIECGEAVPEGRLELVPYAERCVACEELLESADGSVRG